MRIPATLAISTLLLTPLAQAKEYPIGEPQMCGGMEVGAVYLQPVEMEPAGMMLAAAQADVHLEADISATEDNRNGWQEGSFVPYLSIHYSLRKKGSEQAIEGVSLTASKVHQAGDQPLTLDVGQDKAALVRALRAEVRIHVRRYRQERRLLSRGSE